MARYKDKVALAMKRAVYLCRKFLRAENADGGQLVEDIARYTEAVRPDRADERNIKAKSFVGFVCRVAAKTRRITGMYIKMRFPVIRRYSDILKPVFSFLPVYSGYGAHFSLRLQFFPVYRL